MILPVLINYFHNSIAIFLDIVYNKTDVNILHIYKQFHNRRERN